MKTTANGISINYTLEGPASGPVVTLSHSLATHLSMWDPQMLALASRFRVLRYDTRGHGATDAPEGAYSLEMLGEDMRALVAAVNPVLRGWCQYFRPGHCHTRFTRTDAWVRMRLRSFLAKRKARGGAHHWGPNRFWAGLGLFSLAAPARSADPLRWGTAV